VTRRAGWLVVLLLGMVVPQEAPGESHAALLSGLQDSRPKVRLAAANAARTRRVVEAIPGLRPLLADAQPAVRAAAALALGELGDEASRPLLVALLGAPSRQLQSTGERALRLLDHQQQARPRFLVALDPPGLPPGVAREAGDRLLGSIRAWVARQPDLRLAAGEERLLRGAALKAHLARRGLQGVLLLPSLAQLEARPRPDASGLALFGAVHVLGSPLLQKRIDLVTSAEASLDLTSPTLGEATRRRLETEVIDAAATSALETLFEQLRQRR